jgi:multicomponent Na+:H+ antiporter subunit D
MMGFPLMSGFASKWMLYAAALQAGQTVPAVIAWAVSLGTVFLGVKATSAVFLGPLPENAKDAHESPASMVWGMGFLAAGSVILGVAPQLAVNTLLNPILRALSLGAIHVTWLGFSPDTGSFSTVGGLVLAVVSLVIGGAIYALAYAARPAAVTSSGAVMAGAGGGVFTGGEPLTTDNRLSAGDFSRIFEQNWKSFFRWSNVDKAYLAVWDGLQAVSRGLGTAIAPLERNAFAFVIILAAAILAAVRWGTPLAQGMHEGGYAAIPGLLTASIAVAAAGLLLTSLVSGAKGKIPLWPCILIVGGLTIAGLLSAHPWLRLGLLESAALLTVIRVWLTARTRAAKLTYLAVVLISALSAFGSELTAHPQSQAWSRALLLTGILVKLAAVPILFWLLRLADELPALVLGLIIAVLDMGAFGEFMTGAANGGVMLPVSLWLGVAAATSFIAALLMLSQRSLKRLLVLSTIEDAGFLLLGVAVSTKLGMEGAMFAAATHALAKALLFICLSAPEKAGELDQQGGLAARFPVSGFGFVFGMLAMLGVPPLLGFAGRWRLYESALLIHPAIAAVFVLSSILALIAYVLALTRQWWGPNPYPDAKAECKTCPKREPMLTKGVIVALVIALLAAGAWPGLLQFVQGGR